MIDAATTNMQFGPYRIEGQIGTGGMAVVYRASDPQGSPVALKILHSHWSTDPTLAARLRREAEIIRKLQHPHIVRVLEYGEHNGLPFLAMEYMAKGSLAERFAKPTGIPLQVMSRILNEISSALDYAHQRGIVHRDLKLENVLVDEQGRTALSDFGISSLIGATRLTMTGTIAGSPLTMSPEQASGMANVGASTDIYSLAVMTYLMATGYYPFTAESPLALINQHLTMIPPVPSDVNPALPKQLDQVLLKGLLKNPDERYQTAGEFTAAIHASVQGAADSKSIIHITRPNPIRPALVTPVAGITSPPPIQEKRRRRTGLLAFGFSLAMVLAFLVILRPSGAPALSVNTPTATDTASVRVVQQASSTPSSTPTHTPTVTPTHTPTPTPTTTMTPATATDAVLNQGISLRSGPGDHFAVLRNLPAGMQVKLLGRSADSAWLLAQLPDGTEGWLPVSTVTTSTPISSLPIRWYGEAASATPVQIASTPNPATQAPPPTLAPIISAPIVDYSAQPESITAGECAALVWTVEGADSVMLGNQPVSASGSLSVCPATTTSYTLRVLQSATGFDQSYRVTVSVNAASQPVLAPTTAPPTSGQPPTAPPVNGGSNGNGGGNSGSGNGGGNSGGGNGGGNSGGDNGGSNRSGGNSGNANKSG